MRFHSSLVPTFTHRLSGGFSREGWTHISWENNVLGIWEGDSQELHGSAKKGSSGERHPPWRDPTRQIPGGME